MALARSAWRIAGATAMSFAVRVEEWLTGTLSVLTAIKIIIIIMITDNDYSSDNIIIVILIIVITMIRSVESKISKNGCGETYVF